MSGGAPSSPWRRVLALDTAGPVIGVALAVDGEVRCRIERITRGADARLLPWARELCEEAGITLSMLDGIGLAVGPGAFTGLRVGIATATGLALSLELPVWPGSSLHSRAVRAGVEGPVLAMLDARKQRVYATLRQGGDELRAPQDLPPEEAIAWAQGDFVATGEGALVYRELVEAAGGRLADEPEHPAVDRLAQLAAVGLARGEGRPAAGIAPVYLRPADAKLPRGGRIG